MPGITHEPVIRERRTIMWQPTERTCKKYHLAGSLATLVSGMCIMYICLVPERFPDVYLVLADARVAAIIPYLLLIALGESLFSLWFFIFRK